MGFAPTLPVRPHCARSLPPLPPPRVCLLGPNTHNNRYIDTLRKRVQLLCVVNWMFFVSLSQLAELILRRSRSFKVIEVGINRKPICDFLLVINSNWHPISYRFGDIAAYCSNFGQFAFLSHFFLGGGSLRTTYDVHFRPIGKRVVDFLLVLIELFSLGVTAKVLHGNIGLKSTISRGGRLTQNFK